MNTKGFVTIATGKDKYYEVAHNLLMSYRLFSRKPAPFAIICDRENGFTADFDQVILFDHPTHSTLDKFRALDLTPFDETIFIDADCLAYRDLNGLWRVFSNCSDFSYLGYTYPFHMHGWVQPEGAGEFQDDIQFSLVYQGGIFFMRKNRLDAFARTCRYILDHFDSFTFYGYPSSDPVDEPIFALASSVFGYKPARGYRDAFCYLPLCHSIEPDIRKGRLNYCYSNYPVIYPRGRFLLHWGFVDTDSEEYKRETARLAEMVSSGWRPGRFLEFYNRAADALLTIASCPGFIVKKCLPLSIKTRIARLLLR